MRKYDLGDYMVSTYGKAGVIVSYLDEPSYGIVDEGGEHHTIGHSRILRVTPKQVLPTNPHAVITWNDGAYLRQIAQNSPDHGWRIVEDVRGQGIWMTAAALTERIGNRLWTELVPASVVDGSHGVDNV